ncbi:reverse transcriptase family protein [Arthrobacter sp. 35W]|uniref:reverse transcriptase family protein n=1 Tax=Arthrobacter sp. 35W TaxID=1132441 RepID=UPI000423A377|nr:reverse transcriptase family protein [Arthrobacter sp. 35W]
MAVATTGAATLARTPRTSPADLATALAHAFLGAESWSKAALVASAAGSLGARRRWLPPLAGHVLAAYHRPPADAPRELAAVVGQCDAFREALAKSARQRKPIRLAHLVPVAGKARDSATDIPRIDTLAELAGRLELSTGELEWFADPGQWNRSARTPRLQHYRYEWRSRPGRVPRLLEIPGTRLRAIQRRILRDLLQPIPLHDAAHGFVPGRSAITGAARHTGNEVVINLDLSTFFARVTPGKIFGVLRQAGYAEAVAHRLTGLCTHAVPARVLAAMPAGGDPGERFAVRQALARAHLPQGAPTSPLLANLALRRLDSRLAGWAAAVGASYTRYADDLAFSGGPDLARGADAFIRGAARIVADEGHDLNRRKTRVRGAATRQSVTGVVVNAHTNISRGDYDRIKAILHHCVLDGPGEQNRSGHPDFQAYLRGRIAWIESLNAARGAQLRAEFDRIQWQTA